MNQSTNPNFFEKLSDIFKKWDEVPPQIRYAPLKARSYDKYKILKHDGNTVKEIAWNITKEDGERLLNHLHDKVIENRRPNTSGEAYFKLERYEIGLGD